MNSRIKSADSDTTLPVREVEQEIEGVLTLQLEPYQGTEDPHPVELPFHFPTMYGVFRVADGRYKPFHHWTQWNHDQSRDAFTILGDTYPAASTRGLVICGALQVFVDDVPVFLIHVT